MTDDWEPEEPSYSIDFPDEPAIAYVPIEELDQAKEYAARWKALAKKLRGEIAYADKWLNEIDVQVCLLDGALCRARAALLQLWYAVRARVRDEEPCDSGP